MFKVFKSRKIMIEEYMNELSIEIRKLELSKLAIEKAANMIAKAIAKSEFIVQRKKGRTKDDVYYRLNVRPNPNETATDFWIEVARKLILETECVICIIDKNFYIVENYRTDESVLTPRTYRNISICVDNTTVKIDKTFTADEILHFKSRNEKIKKYLENALKKYDEIISALSEAKRISSTPKFALNIKGMQAIIREKTEEGIEKTLTIDEYKKKIRDLLESEKIEIITNQEALNLEELKITTSVSSEDITKIAHEIFTECAFAFDIPKAVFLGEITEKADSTNEFITYAVSWVAEIITDSLNAKLVGKNSYLKGERIWIDMTTYKHVDIIESAGNLDKLRAIGFSLDEIFRMVGWEELDTEFSRQRVVTKNYMNDPNE